MVYLVCNRIPPPPKKKKKKKKEERGKRKKREKRKEKRGKGKKKRENQKRENRKREKRKRREKTPNYQIWCGFSSEMGDCIKTVLPDKASRCTRFGQRRDGTNRREYPLIPLRPAPLPANARNAIFRAPPLLHSPVRVAQYSFATQALSGVTGPWRR